MHDFSSFGKRVMVDVFLFPVMFISAFFDKEQDSGILSFCLVFMKEQESSFILVRTPGALGECLHRMAHTDSVALDTEADSLHHYYEKVCLIQVSLDGRHYILDPLGDLDLTPLLDLLARKNLIFHGGDYDLRMLRLTFDFRSMGPVFDTMIAARILGYGEFGLAALVERFFGVVLCKKRQKSDWSKRPLSPKQLEYAADDTRYLKELAAILKSELKRLGRLEWHRESCNRMKENSGKDNPRDPGEIWRIRGAGLLSRRELAFLREIWLWRDTEARMTDLPPFKIMGNQQLLRMVQWILPRTRNPLRGFKLPRNCRGRRLEALNQAISKARHTPPRDWPKLRESRTSRESETGIKSLIEALRKECASLAEKIEVESSLIASRASLTAIARNRARTIPEIVEAGGLMNWQAELLLPALEKLWKKHQNRSNQG